VGDRALPRYVLTRGLGIGDWGFGIRDSGFGLGTADCGLRDANRGLRIADPRCGSRQPLRRGGAMVGFIASPEWPIPNPQSPVPNPQSPIPNPRLSTRRVARQGHRGPLADQRNLGTVPKHASPDRRNRSEQRSAGRLRRRTTRRQPACFFQEIQRSASGMRFDEQTRGRVGSTGCVTSGRRWHRRSPVVVSRTGAASSP